MSLNIYTYSIIHVCDSLCTSHLFTAKCHSLRQMYMCICTVCRLCWCASFLFLQLFTTYCSKCMLYTVHVEHSKVKNYHFKKRNCFVSQAHVLHSMNSTLYMYMYRYFEVNVTSLLANCWLKKSLHLGQSTSMNT